MTKEGPIRSAEWGGAVVGSSAKMFCRPRAVSGAEGEGSSKEKPYRNSATAPCRREDSRGAEPLTTGNGG